MYAAVAAAAVVAAVVAVVAAASHQCDRCVTSSQSSRGVAAGDGIYFAWTNSALCAETFCRSYNILTASSKATTKGVVVRRR